MRHWKRMWAKLNTFLHRGRVESDLAREMETHLALLMEQFQRRGMSPEEARLTARREYGGIDQAKELHRDERSIVWMEQVLQDVRYAWRSLLKSPSFATVAVLTLALGIGANIAIFTVVNAVLLRPLPFQEPEKLVRVFDDLKGASVKDIGMSVPELEDLRRSGIFEGITVIFPVSTALSGGDHTERIEMLGTNVNYFQMLGARAALGRVYGPEDAQPGFSDGVVISDGLWQRQFGGDPHVLGKRIRVDEDGYTIIGVMPPEFRHPGQTLAGDVDFWAAAGFMADPFPHPPLRAQRYLPGVMARLKRGITLQQAQQQLDALAAHLREMYPKDYPAAGRWSLRVELAQQSLTENIQPTLLVLMAAVGFLLLIVCVNLASLLIARSSARMRELAIRQALGASRARLIRQLLTESVLLSMAGGLAAVAVLAAAKGSLVAMMPADLPRVSEVHFNLGVAGLAILLSVGTGVLFGLAPALDASRKDPNEDLKEGGRSGGSSLRQSRFRGFLVATEIALSVVLLIGAGLLVRSFWDMLRVNPGLDTKDLLVARIWIPYPNHPEANRYRTPAPIATLSREIMRQARSLPGIREVAMGGAGAIPFQPDGTNVLPFTFSDESDGGRSVLSASLAAASPEYFQVLKTPLLGGRFFTDQDSDKSKRVALVNEAFVKKFARGQGLIGKRMRFREGNAEIVGIVGDVHHEGLDAPATPHIYFSQYQSPAGEMSVLMRGRSDMKGLREAVVGMVHGIDPDLPVYGVRTMEEIMAGSMARRKFSLFLMALFAGLALFLASIGIYGVMAYAVAQRAQEFGIRMALGAQPQDVMLQALRPGMMLTLSGVLVGVAAALAVARAISGLLFGVSPYDPATFVAVPALLASVALLACWIPARRAVQVSPVVALRS